MTKLADFDRRLLSTLRAANLTLVDATRLGDLTLLRIPNLGRKSLARIRRVNRLKVSKITPEMIEAGTSILYKMTTHIADEEYWAEEIYQAMEKARISESC